MLVPALACKDEILKKFAKEMYSDRYFWYMGYALGHELPSIDDSDGNFRWAIVDDKDPENILGYFAYRINLEWSSATSFGWYAFQNDNSCLGKNVAYVVSDIKDKMFELFANYHRTAWCMIGDNPVESAYNKILKEAESQGYTIFKEVSHDCVKDEKGNYHDSIEFEVLNYSK